MNKKVLIGIIGIFVIAAIVLGVIQPMRLWLLFWAALIVAWICLLWAFRKRGTRIFHDQMEPETAEKRLRWLKRLLLIGGISLGMFVIGVVVHNVLYGVMDREESVSFFVAVLGGLVLFLSNIGILVLVITGRMKPGKKR